VIEPTQHSGKVILAGAGPGDPELITVKAARYLRQADVVIADRLVSPALLSENTKPGAKVFMMGKQGGHSGSFSQQAINDLLVRQALQNKLVVRLKGGDVSFFSNILDELQTLQQHHIAYEIIPGVTAASGAAAYAGIPLTARGYATAVRFLTCHQPESIAPTYWKELAATDDTLVFYMSSNSLEEVVNKLVENKISPDKHVAIIEQATTPFQKVQVKNIHHYLLTMGEEEFASPSLVIIGRVAGLHEQFRWKESSMVKKDYFLPLHRKTELKKFALEYVGG
jgi:uroporphyrin-III C-methyltransferase